MVHRVTHGADGVDRALSPRIHQAKHILARFAILIHTGRQLLVHLAAQLDLARVEPAKVHVLVLSRLVVQGVGYALY